MRPTCRPVERPRDMPRSSGPSSCGRRAAAAAAVLEAAAGAGRLGKSPGPRRALLPLPALLRRESARFSLLGLRVSLQGGAGVRGCGWWREQHRRAVLHRKRRGSAPHAVATQGRSRCHTPSCAPLPASLGHAAAAAARPGANAGARVLPALPPHAGRVIRAAGPQMRLRCVRQAVDQLVDARCRRGALDCERA